MVKKQSDGTFSFSNGRALSRPRAERQAAQARRRESEESATGERPLALSLSKGCHLVAACCLRPDPARMGVPTACRPGERRSGCQSQSRDIREPEDAPGPRASAFRSPQSPEETLGMSLSHKSSIGVTSKGPRTEEEVRLVSQLASSRIFCLYSLPTAPAGHLAVRPRSRLEAGSVACHLRSHLEGPSVQFSVDGAASSS